MDKIKTRRGSVHHSDVLTPIVIYEKDNTRRVFLARINDAHTETQEIVSGTLVHQRKKRGGDWEEPVEVTNLAALKGGEGVKMAFHSKDLRKFYEGLKELYALSAEGLQFGETEYTVGKADEVMKVPKERQVFVQQLIANQHGEEVWRELVKENPSLATRLSLARIQKTRQDALDEFERNLTEDKDEPYWQDFFERNLWIFGYGLRYCFLSRLASQPSYGGQDVTGKGGQMGDFLMCSEAEARFTVLVEIKKPSSKLLLYKNDGSARRYRNGAYHLGQELIGGTSQLQVSCRTWQRHSGSEENLDALGETLTVNPKTILLIGNTAELTGDREKKVTFESFRRSMNNPEVLTYDELLARAKFIVSSAMAHTAECVMDKSVPPF